MAGRRLTNGNGQKMSIFKEKDSRTLTQFRPILLLKIRESFLHDYGIEAHQYGMSNQYDNTTIQKETIQKEGVPGVPWCIKHTTMILE